MKKIFLFILMLLLMPLSVMADEIYSVDLKIDIALDGTAKIIETMDVDASDGSEWYKEFRNIRKDQISDYVVYMDGEKLQYKEWNIDESLSEKAGYYGISYTDSGLELCFGKSDMNRHTFTLYYTISDFIINTEDSQVLYWTLLPNVTLNNFTIDVSSPYEFLNTDNIWAYGYKGYVYVEDGNIKMYNDGKLKNDYVVLLAKYPLNTFNTTYSVDGYDNFNDIYQMAEDGSYEYGSTGFDKFMNIFGMAISIAMYVFLFIGIGISIKFSIDRKYGYKNNKKIDKKNVPIYRDIPCKKDIYYANVLIKLNSFGYRKGNIIGAIILKWVRDNKVKFKNEKKGIFNRDTSMIDLSLNPSFNNKLEKELFDMMYKASNDGLLEAKELQKWCRKNYEEYFGLIEKMEEDVIDSLKDKEYIYRRNNRDECKYKNVMSDKIYDDSVKLYGLKLYLESFSKMDTKEVMEVKLWDEYLMFAYLFGMANKVLKQLKDMYPDLLENKDYDYDTLVFINSLSIGSVNAASGAMASSSGGGGGSFGGGGSMGGR